ncbi:TSUP family transporter, partial [Streptococcus suis]
PGAIGAFAGATFLSRLSTESATPWTTAILLVIGVYLLIRFGFGLGKAPALALDQEQRQKTGFLVPLGVVGGFVDASGGGGWGPITTS